MYLEKLKLVSQSSANSIGTSSNDEKKWDKLAKNVRIANNPLLTGNGINKKKPEDDKAEPAIGVLIDFEDKDNNKRKDC